MENKFNYQFKGYTHFDKRIKVSDAKEYVENPGCVAKHSFYPFIHFTKKWIKYSKQGGTKVKPRELCYAAHMDSYIYQLYGYKLNCLYNKTAKQFGFNKCATAYRNNIHKSNVEFAKDAIDFIRKTKDALIIVGDFTKFFDRLDHRYLKNMLLQLMNVEKLPDDYYAVYKNITKHSYIELDDLLKINGNISYKDLKEKDVVLSIKDFHKYKKEYLHINNKDFGIPQGSSISSVLSNIFMMNFDKKINDYVTSNGGMYRRYSDDFIVVVPWVNYDNLKIIWSFIESCVNSVDNLELQKTKTKVFHYNNGILNNCNKIAFEDQNNSKNILEYLGFAFNGQAVSLRDKTVSKYYYRLNHKIDGIKNTECKSGIKVPRYKLFKKYSHLGSHSKKCREGNFITYVNRCEKVFGPDERVSLVKKRHWKKINKRVKKTEVKT